MVEVKSGDTVRIHYTGTLADGTVFDSSDGRDPLEFTVGAGQVIPGLDAAMPGMAEGASQTVTIQADRAYGPRLPDAQQSVPRRDFPDDLDLKEGLRLQMQTSEGRTVAVVVAKVSEDLVVLDANHPLAGEDLTFAFTLVSIV
ncbi:MAG: peptidylprolyl isomerase [Pseudomonadota bacterium]